MKMPTFELRQRSKSGSYSTRFKFLGKEYSKTFKGVTVRRVAEQKAKEFFQEEVLPNLQQEEEDKSNLPLSEFLKVYLDDSKTALMKVSPATKKENVRVLKAILRVSFPEIEKVRIRDIDRAIVSKWVAANKGGNDTTLASNWAQAKSVFSRKAIQVYEDNGLAFPKTQIQNFASLLLKRGDVQAFKPFKKEFLRAMDEEIRGELCQETATEFQKDIYRVYVMASQLGMRAGEIFNTRTGQLEQLKEGWVIHIATTKRGNPRSIYLNDELKELLLPTGKPHDAETFVVGHGLPKTTRENLISRHSNRFLRRWIKGSVKCLHQLRKQFGSDIATAKGLFAAQHSLGHRSYRVTEAYYSSYTGTIDAISPYSTASIQAPSQAAKMSG